MAALERHWYASDDRPLRAWVLAAITALIATQLLAAAGLATPGQSFYITEPLPIAGAIVGGLMFGVGMALVGTCGFGALVRLGGGNLRALVVLTGLGLAALAAQRGVTGHIRVALLDPLSIDLTSYGGQSLGALLSGAIGFDVSLILALVLGCTGLWWVFRPPIDKAWEQVQTKPPKHSDGSANSAKDPFNFCYTRATRTAISPLVLSSPPRRTFNRNN